MRSAGIALILLTLTALWLYNTGRLEAALAVIKDPSAKPGKTQYVAGLGTTSADGTTPDTTGIAGIGGSTPPISGDLGSILGDIFGGIDIFGGLI